MKSLLATLFCYISSFEIYDGIIRYYPCLLNRDICYDLRAGYVVDEIIVYPHEKYMEIYHQDFKYIVPLWIGTGQPCKIENCF